MIQDMVLPERYGSYFFITRRVAACMITPLSVRIAVIRISRSQRFIEQLLEQPVDQDPAMPLQERIAAAVEQIVRAVPASARLMVVMPSTQVIFKMITVPLMSLEKIKLIVPFEVESMLPFSWADAAIDCIVTGENKAEKTADVLVIATTKVIIEEQKMYFASSGRVPGVVTASALALCGLSQDMPQFVNQERPVVTLCVDQQETILIVVQRGTIVALRSLPQGMRDLFADEGMKQSALQNFVHAVVATGTSFLEQLGGEGAPKLIICGMGSEHKELCEAITAEWQVACELLTINKLLHTGTLVSQAGMTNAFLVPIAAALPYTLTEEVNLDRTAAEEEDRRTILRQLIGAGILVVLLFGGLFITRGMMLRRMRATYESASREAVTLLEKNIDELMIRKGSSLDSANKEAERRVAEERNMWFSLASPNRFVALQVLLELSKRLKREELGLQLRKLDFEFIPREERKKLVLEGKVKDIEALKSFEASFKASSLLSLSETLQTPEFVAHIKFTVPEE